MRKCSYAHEHRNHIESTTQKDRWLKLPIPLLREKGNGDESSLGVRGVSDF
jgi:hypothetical protein